MSLTIKSKIIVPTALVVLILDRLTKSLVVDWVCYGDMVPVVPGFFDLTYVRNTGAAFSLMAGARDSVRLPFLVLTSLAAVVVLFYFIRITRPEHRLVLFALSLILGGAAGNLIDRAFYGSVIDFIYWHIGGYYWPAFNIADSGITVGVTILCGDMLLSKRAPGGMEA